MRGNHKNKHKKNNRTPRVAVLVDTSTEWGRGIHAGIHKYDIANGPWQLFVESRGLEQSMLVPHGWDGDGIIARIGNLDMAKDLRALGIPVVNVSGLVWREAKYPLVSTDLVASGRISAQYFLDRGYRYFGYFCLNGLFGVIDHLQAFAEKVAEAGCSFSVFETKPTLGGEPDWNLDLGGLDKWLKSLEKPAAILTWNPSSAREIIYACEHLGISVPEQVAVLSARDDNTICEMIKVPISGVVLPAEKIGYHAAATLHRLMQGKSAPTKPQLFAPERIVTRQSTDSLAIKDPILVKALKYIRENAGQLIKIDDVCRHVGVSRRLLERHFNDGMQRTPATEIRRVHLERAKLLLAETDKPIPDVSDASGFGSSEYMSQVFRQELDTTPLKYRRDVRCR